MSYNGWSNYETWNVNLWLANEEPSYRYWRAAAHEAMEAEGNREEATRKLADQLKDEVSDAAPLDGASLYTDLLNAALGEVDWREIAASWLEDVPEPEPDEDEDDEEGAETGETDTELTARIRRLLDQPKPEGGAR